MELWLAFQTGPARVLATISVGLSSESLCLGVSAELGHETLIVAMVANCSGDLQPMADLVFILHQFELVSEAWLSTVWPYLVECKQFTRIFKNCVMRQTRTGKFGSVNELASRSLKEA